MVMEVAGPLTEIHHGLLINKNMIVTIVQYIGGYYYCMTVLIREVVLIIGSAPISDCI